MHLLSTALLTSALAARAVFAAALAGGVAYEKHDDADGLLAFDEEAWTTEQDSALYQGAQHITDQPDAAATFSFTGQHFILLGTTGPDFGNFSVSAKGADGVQAFTKSAYSEEMSDGQDLFNSFWVGWNQNNACLDWDITIQNKPTSDNATSLSIDAVNLQPCPSEP